MRRVSINVDVVVWRAGGRWWASRRRTCEPGIVERADGSQDLFHAGTETADPRRTVFLMEQG